MVFRAVNRWRTLLAAATNRGARCRPDVSTPSSTAPRSSKAFSTTISDDSPRQRRKMEGEFFPVYVSVGMIALSASLGLLAAHQQLRYSPNVYVSKKRREMLPEVYDPDWAAAETERFLSRSIFRRVAHLRDFHRVRPELSDPAPPRQPSAPVTRAGRVEDLRTVGLDPHPH